MPSKTPKGVALITGASSGIGAIYADRMAKRGYDLILVARNLQRLEQLAERLRREAHVEVDVLSADLTIRADLFRVEEVLRCNQRIAVLINNAGISMRGDLIGASPDTLELMIMLNVLALSRLVVAALPGFLARSSGTIINIGSVLALVLERFNAGYGATKDYVLHFTLKLQEEVGNKGIRVQAVLPGATRTEIWEKAGIIPSPDTLMEVDEMVDAALVGLDRGEIVTIPSLPEVRDWDAYTAARLKLGPNLSRPHAASRYRKSDPPTGA